jgi:hypothetical protein
MASGGSLILREERGIAASAKWLEGLEKELQPQ